MLRRRMQFLKEENERNIAAMAIGSALHSSSIDNVVEDVHSSSCERRRQHGKKQQHSALHEISLEEEEDRLSTTIDNNFNYLKSPRRHAERNNNIPVVKLFPSNYYHDATTDENKSRNYLDFGEEGNVVGSTMWRSFLVVAPSLSDGNNNNNSNDPDSANGCDNGNAEYHVTFKRWIPEKGIMCSISDETIGNSTDISDGITVDNRKRGDANNATLSNNNVALSDRPIHFSLEGGEVKIVHVSWSPPQQRENGGCVIRESMDLEVMAATTVTKEEEEDNNDDRCKVCWQRHSIVIVGEAKAMVVDEDENDNNEGESSSTVQDLIGDSNKFIEGGGMMVMSTITNSTEEFNLQRGRSKAAASSEDEEREEEEPETIGSIMEQSWNNLSEIQEVYDQDDDTDDEDCVEDGEYGETVQHCNLESDGDASPFVVGPLDPIGEARSGTPVGSTTSSTTSSTSSSDISSCSESSEISELEELAEMLQQLRVIKSPPEESRDQAEGWATIVGRGDDAAVGRERGETMSTSTGQRKQRVFAEEEESAWHEQRPVAHSNVRGKQREHAVGREQTAMASLQQSPHTEDVATVPHEHRNAASHGSPRKQAQHFSTREETAKSCVRIEEIEKGEFSEKGGESFTSADSNNSGGGLEEPGEVISVPSEENSEMPHNRSDAASSPAREEKLLENREVGAAFMDDLGEDVTEGTGWGETLTTETAQQHQLPFSEEGLPTLCNRSKTTERIGVSRHAEYAVIREETAKVTMQLEDMEEELVSEKGEGGTALAGSKNGGCGLEEPVETISVSSVEIVEMPHHRSDAVQTPPREDKPQDQEGCTALIGDHGEDAVGGIERNETVATKTAQHQKPSSSEEITPTLHDHQLAADHTSQRRHAEYAAIKEETAKVSLQLQSLEKEHCLEELEKVEEESMSAISNNSGSTSEERREMISGSSGVISEMLNQSDAVTSPARQEKPQDQQEECSGTPVADRGEHSHSIEVTVQQNQPTTEGTTSSYNEEGTTEHKDTANFNSRRQTDAEKESEAPIVEQNTNEEPEQAATVASLAGNKWQETVAVSLLEDMGMEHTQAEDERARTKEAAATQRNDRQMRDRNDELEEMFASKGLVVDAAMEKEPNPSANGNDDDDDTRGRRRCVRFVTDGLYHDDDEDSVSHQIFVEKDGRPHDNMKPNPKDTSAPSSGSISSEDGIIGDHAHIRHDFPLADDPPSALAGSISRCLAEVNSSEGKYLDVSSFNEYLEDVHDSNLVNGDDSLEDEDLARQDILSHPSRHVDEDEEYSGFDSEEDNLEIDFSELNPNEEIIFTKMMERATSEDEDRYPPNKSFDSLHDLEHEKSELNAFIDSVSKIQQVTHFQHDYIMSPTEDDFYTQLDHLNDQIDQIPDGITPPSFGKRKSLSSVSDDPPQVDSFTETILLPGEKKDCLARNDKISSNGLSNENRDPTARTREGKEEIERKKPIRSKPKRKNGTNNLSSAANLGFKTPSPHHRSTESVASPARSEQLQVLVENAHGDDSKQRADSVVGSFDSSKGARVTERHQHPQFTPTNKPKEKVLHRSHISSGIICRSYFSAYLIYNGHNPPDQSGHHD